MPNLTCKKAEAARVNKSPFYPLLVLHRKGIFISLFTGLFMFCSSCKKIEETTYPEPLNAQGDYPLMELKDTSVLDLWEKDRLVWVLKTRHLTRMMHSEEIRVRPVLTVIYDSLGREAGWVEADSGSADESASYMKTWGRVHIRAKKGAKVWTDSLYWDNQTRSISTDGPVKVVSVEGDTLTGVGFRSDDELRNWKILSRVRGVIQRAEKRQNNDIWKVPGPEDGL